MKNILFLAILVNCSLISNAQYKNYKKDFSGSKYLYQDGDRYKPSSAAAFAIIPGLGHVYVNQPIRGLIFPGGMIVSSYLIASGSLSEWSSGWGNESSNSGEIQIALGLAGFFGFYIWNFIDVVHVTKIKNLYYRKNELSFQIVPYIENGYNKHLNSNTAGLTLQVNF